MFNIKSIVKQITERSRDSNVESSSKGTDDPFSQKTEGFLCPKCMKQLPSPWELQTHYESVHEEDISTELNVQPLASVLGSEASLEEGAEQSSVDQDVAVCDGIANSSLTVEDVPLLTDVHDLQQRLQQALMRKSVLESRVVRLVQSNVTLKTAVDEMDCELNQLRERHKILEAQLAHRESIDDAAVLRQELVQVQRVMDEMNRERERERDDLQAKLQLMEDKESENAMIETLKMSLSEKEEECRKLLEEVEQLKVKHEIDINNMRDTLKEISSCKSEASLDALVGSSEESVEEKLITADNRLHEEEFVKPLSERNHPEESAVAEQCRAFQRELDFKKSEMNNLTKHNEQLKEQLSKKTDELKRNLYEIESTKQKLTAQNRTLETMEDQQKELCVRLSREKQTCSTLTSEINKISEEKICLENKLQTTLLEHTVASSKLTDLQHSLAQLEHEHQNLQMEHQHRLEELRNSIQEKSELLQKQENAVQLLVSERAELSQQLELLETTKSREAEEAFRKMEKLQKEISEKEEIRKHLESNLVAEAEKSCSLQDKINKLNESSEVAIKAKNEEMKTIQSSLDEITGEKLALEAQLEATGAEQQKLLERCYASASEIETLHHTVAELRRKWEESESALQELGRENATLQLDIEKLLARKWAEDADVTQCTLCHREFTMLLRKHHCRNCGQIFCNECSSKTAAVVSNKKPVRVCDSCYAELRTK